MNNEKKRAKADHQGREVAEKIYTCTETFGNSFYSRTYRLTRIPERFNSVFVSALYRHPPTESCIQQSKKKQQPATAKATNTSMCVSRIGGRILTLVFVSILVHLRNVQCNFVVARTRNK